MHQDDVKGRLAVVFGASGFVGRYIVRALARDGWRVRAAERRPDLAGFLQPMGAVGQIMPVQANVRFPDSVAAAVAGADVVINCVAVMTGIGRQTLEAVNVEGAATVARAAKAAGVARLIHISAIGADPHSVARYARSKGEAEAAVREAFPEAIVIRPSLVFGPEDEFFNRFAGMAVTAPLLPLVGAKTKFQPVFVGDLAAAACNAAGGAGKSGTTYEIGGPAVLTMRQMLDIAQAGAGRHRGYLPLPSPLAKLAALLTWPLPNSLRPLTVDQVRMLGHDNVVSDAAKAEGRTLAGLGVNEVNTVGSVVPGYLERFKARGQYSHYRG